MIIHLITFGIIAFEFVVFLIQWFIFKKEEFLYFSLFCLSIGLHYYLYVESYFPWGFFVEQYPEIDIFLRRQLGIISILMYIRFAKNFISNEPSYPQIAPRIISLEKITLANILWQFLAVFIIREEPYLEYSFAICFIVITAYAALLGYQFIKKRIVLFNFIIVGSLLSTFGGIVLIFCQTIGFNRFDPQVFLGLGLILNVFLLNIGIIYKFTFLNQEQLENQQRIIQNLIEKEQLAQHLLSIRNRISMDIHDDILGGLSTIRISSELIEPSNPEMGQIFAKKISKTAKDTAQRLNAIIWSLDNQQDELSNFVHYIKTFGYDFFKDTTIKYHFQANINASSSLILKGDIRKHLFFTIKEAFHNILKHAQATNVTLTIEKDNQNLFILIQDNGVGLGNKRRFGNGLHNMEKRMQDIGGNITFESNEGTKLYLQVPLPH